ncbi:alpha/beta fold hydrolase [Kitasatospora sp. NPDC088346]|uniref:alpha/beta fold hydrolase n=1 Tax=Kitasatospora sp. NPDC088346 TaxID=3364073 RepID=UPI00380C5BF6
MLALHGHFSAGRTFTRLARDLAPDWRVVALDQRGPGCSDRPSDFSRDGYVEDAAAVLHHLGAGAAVVLGHSLGGVNAYQLASGHPELVRALVIEDIGAEVNGDLSFCLDWPHRAPTRGALLEALGRSAPHLTDVIREYGDGWGLAFHPEDMVASQHGGRVHAPSARQSGSSPRQGSAVLRGGAPPSPRIPRCPSTRTTAHHTGAADHGCKRC